MTRDLRRRLERVEMLSGTHRARVRLFLEPSGHPDPQAFARECYAAAGEDQAIIVQFVKPTPRPAAQLPQEGPLQ